MTAISIQAISDQKHGDPAAFIIIPFFLLIGLYLGFGRFVVDAFARGRTTYTLTSRRALIDSGLFTKAERSINLAVLPEIGLRERRSGRGTVTFGANGGGPFAMMPRNWPGARQFLPPAFDGIDDVRRVYDLALKAQRDSQAKTAS